MSPREISQAEHPDRPLLETPPPHPRRASGDNRDLSDTGEDRRKRKCRDLHLCTR